MAITRVYVQMRKRITAIPGQVLRIKDVARLLADGEEKALEDLPVFRYDQDLGNLAVVDLMDVLAVLRRTNEGIRVESVGLTHTIIEMKKDRKVPVLLYVCLVWLLLFIGSGLAIMNFHTDVSMRDVHQRIYYLMTGMNNSHPLIMQIPYSFGIGLGMLLFFNHLFNRKFNEEPSPLELEVFLYQENMDQYVIDHEKTKKNGKGAPDGRDP
ncbi:stage V sporulation protein AA [Marininema mesophilum]|uniref:Stage V sporulation protein AA n=1 Tax=Marininema mesophilum TaxID=1048340 RepID=A0A1H2UJT6_9BACL|nr:stage V sporulation protein AA [Marininema mesophilum]SDW55859.1 stage V sporulation protein AA [Marininema mesophilum]